jgi:hypothetical protein
MYHRSGRPLRILLTVSPVPLTATATNQHVLSATSYSKSVLRAVSGDLAQSDDAVDYFPSYEIITNQAARSAFYDHNLRSVRNAGVQTVMRTFLEAHGMVRDVENVESVKESVAIKGSVEKEESVQCEEILLEAFGER